MKLQWEQSGILNPAVAKSSVTFMQQTSQETAYQADVHRSRRTGEENTLPAFACRDAQERRQAEFGPAIAFFAGRSC